MTETDKIYYSGPQLAKRWGLSRSLFAKAVKLGNIPKQTFFGDQAKYYIDDIRHFENTAGKEAEPKTTT